MNSGIYSVLNLINSKQYIGQAIDLDERQYEHFNGYSSNRHLQNSMKHYGKENFVFVILEIIPVHLLDERENYWLKLYPFNKLYNIATEARSKKGVKHSEESKRKMAKSKYKRVKQFDISTGALIASFESIQEAHDTTKSSYGGIGQTCNGAGLTVNGYTFRYETYPHIRLTDNELQAIKDNSNIPRPVLQIDVDTGEIVTEYASCLEAANAFGCSRDAIQKVCIGKNKTSQNYKWIYDW